ncbi:MAG: DUF6600 domain-containing protein [Ignavibacteria bacterium]|jgi:hypothetical protein
MKTSKILSYIVSFLLLLFLFSVKAYSQIEVDTTGMGPPDKEPTLQDLQDSLSGSGDWVQITQDEMDPEAVEGEDSSAVEEDLYTDYVWIPNPTLIYIGWNPYCYGRWVYTCWGWEWIPYDNWGWCTYHYGRWWWSNHHHSWVWSPGHRWRHNWVTWYHSGGYWGWHPLPPRVRYRGGIAVVPRTKDVQNDGWVFVDKKNFTKTVDKTSIIDVNKHNEIFNNSGQTAKEDEKKQQTTGPNINVPDTRKTDNKTSPPNTGQKNSDYGTTKDPGNNEVKPKEKKENTNKTDYNSGNKNSNESWYTPPKQETQQSPPPKQETQQSPPPKVEQKQSPPPKSNENQSPPPKQDDKGSKPQNKNNSSGN